MGETAAKGRRITYLDGLRGLAALLVVFFHTSSAFVPAIIYGTAHGGIAHVFYSAPILNIWMQGNFMVCVFYALSGFALAYATLSRGGVGSAISGLVRRYPRLAIPTMCATVIAFVMLRLKLFPVQRAAAISHSSWLAGLWQFTPSLKGAVREGAIGVFGSHGSAYDAPLWTMHNELRGSLIVFAVLILAPRRGLRMIAYAALAILTFHSYLLGFVAGMAICELTLTYGQRGESLARKHLWWIAPIGIFGLVLGSYPTPSSTMPSFYDHLLPHIFGSGAFAQQIGTNVVGAILVLVAVVALRPVQRALETAPMQFLGRISFALYLLHFLVMGSLGAETVIFLHGPLPYAIAAIAAFVVVVGVSMLAAWAFTLFVDEPSTARLKRAYQWIARHVVQIVPVAGPVLAPARKPAAPVTIEPVPPDEAGHRAAAGSDTVNRSPAARSW